MTNFQIGVQLYSIRDHTTNFGDMLTAMHELKNVGCNICQISGVSDDITFTQMREIIDQTGVQCICTHTDFEKMEDNLGRVLENHRLIGCRYIGVGMMPSVYFRSEEGFLEFAHRANTIADKMHDVGMQFIYHNHHVEFIRMPSSGKLGMELLLENFSDSVQFEPDFFWIQAGGGNVLEWIRMLRGRSDIVHFKEMGGNLNFEKLNMLPVGDGAMNWDTILNACDYAGVKYAMIEQDNAVETDSLNCMRRSINYLRKHGGRF